MIQKKQLDWRFIAFAVCAVGFVFLQIPMAYVGTELSWANGMADGVQTFRTGWILGVGLGIFFSVFVLTLGLKWFRKKPVPAISTLIVIGGGLCIMTVLVTMARAAASFLFYLEP